MLIKNLLPGELVNGSIGQVVDFLTAGEAVNGNTDIGFVDPTNEMRDDAAGGPNRDIPLHILQSPHIWPVVHWAVGRKMMMVPVAFTIENVHGDVEAARGQVSHSMTLPIEDLGLMCSRGTTHPGMGHKYPQIPRSNASTSTNQPRTDIREGPGLRWALSGDIPGHTPGSQFRSSEVHQ
ncbi:hypothetical protein BJ322DRAFT_1057549 [Thelephora terrestris]|uniref:Uncharacterized protein n=1 Tax=Thelephora terrestris TaxID=56493 RepID=A0A9P6HGZ4_9AGAM|nr:hypothetical protein BJ322DRAFT_1057549 [Thelephora terrestris]